ncbi:hypothetical protein ACIPTZ_20940 [Pectobacterium sp. CHL-2024]|uniref:hypothetical protein n=1 Tax=Pectobacterium sp. CHL-2024 TaxID=3377079 RepID=UPI0038102370
MRILLDSKELCDLPLVERKLTLDDCIMFADFSIIGDLDFEITLCKKYDSREDVIRSYECFLNNSSSLSINWVDKFSFQEQQIKSKLELLRKLINGKLPLPDGGEGFLYNGDLSYIKKMIKELVEE